MAFLGFFTLDATDDDRLMIVERTTNTSGVIVDADAVPIYTIYQSAGSSAKMPSGTGSMSLRDTGNVTGAADNGSGLIRITSSAHGLQTGDRIKIASVGGTTEANDTWTITKIDANTFDLVGSTFSNAYTSGGSWHVLGLYYAQHSITTANGYEAGKTYWIVGTYAVSSSTKQFTHTFTVV